MPPISARIDITTHLRGLTAAGIGIDVVPDLHSPAIYDPEARVVRVRDDLNPCEYGVVVCQVLQREIRATGLV